MRSNQIGELSCAIARAIGTVGDPWTLMIVREIFLGSRKFEDLLAQLRVSPALLTQRLKELVADGILSKRPYQDAPVRHEYHLTRKGLDLWPLMLALKHWGDRWGGWKGRPPAELRHRHCRSATGMKLVCECCGEPLTPFDVELRQREPMRTQRAQLQEEQRLLIASKSEARAQTRRRKATA